MEEKLVIEQKPSNWLAIIFSSILIIGGVNTTIIYIQEYPLLILLVDFTFVYYFSFQKRKKILTICIAGVWIFCIFENVLITLVGTLFFACALGVCIFFRHCKKFVERNFKNKINEEEIN